LLFLFCFCFWSRILLHSSVWPQTYIPPASAFPVLAPAPHWFHCVSEALTPTHQEEESLSTSNRPLVPGRISSWQSWGMHHGDKGGDNSPSAQSQIMSPQEMLWEFASWDTRLWGNSRKYHFIVPAQIQVNHLQRLSPENTGVSPYIPLQAGYRRKNARSNPCTVIFNFIGYFILVLHDFPLPGAMWPSSCSDFSGFPSMICHPYLPATFSGLRPTLLSYDPSCLVSFLDDYWAINRAPCLSSGF
jgi:hypothetical protein